VSCYANSTWAFNEPFANPEIASNRIAAGYKDKDGAWIALNAQPLFYAYNTEQVGTDDVPKSTADCLKP
jgi:Bacterial extracellular solute-binding protein